MEGVSCAVTGALSGDALTTLPVASGESVGQIRKRIADLLSCDASFTLLFDGVLLRDEEKLDVDILARISSGASLQLMRHQSHEVEVFAVNHNIMRRAEGTAGLRFAA